MKNKRFNIQRTKDKLFRHDALDQFDAAWAQLTARGWFAVEANGGWTIGDIL